jgi:predicted phage replisome organizer
MRKGRVKMADVKWIKLATDVFDDEKILLIESLPEADSIIVIWFKLLCLAGKQNNSGVFVMGNAIPYTDTMLATIFRRKETTVKLALETFERFGMVELIDDVITIPNWNKHQSLDSYEKKKERDRLYQAERRAAQKAIAQKSSDKSSDIAISEEDKKRKEVDKKEKKNIPTVYYPTDELLNQAFVDYVAMRKQVKSPMTERAIQLAMNKLEQLSGGDNDKAIRILEQSVMNSWKGLFELKDNKQINNKPGGIDWDNV